MVKHQRGARQGNFLRASALTGLAAITTSMNGCIPFVAGALFAEALDESRPAPPSGPLVDPNLKGRPDNQWQVAYDGQAGKRGVNCPGQLLLIDDERKLMFVPDNRRWLIDMNYSDITYVSGAIGFPGTPGEVHVRGFDDNLQVSYIFSAYRASEIGNTIKESLRVR